MRLICETERFEQKRKNWERLARQIEMDKEKFYQHRNVCPECEGKGNYTVLCTDEEYVNRCYLLRKKRCFRCLGYGLYVESRK